MARARQNRSEPQPALAPPPRKIAGVSGRTIWFSERAGALSESQSLERKLDANRIADSMPSLAMRKARAYHEARKVLAAAIQDGRRVLETSLALDANGKPIGMKAQQKSIGLTAIAPTIEIAPGGQGPVTVVFPLPDQVAQSFDLETVAVVGPDPAGSQLSELFAYWPEERAVVGQVDGPGLYQPHAMPLEASARRLIESLASGWNHIGHESILRLLASQAGARQLTAELTDKICALISKAAGESNFESTGGQPPSRIVGPLSVDKNGRVVPPAMVRWHRRRRWSCSRWRCIGPSPHVDFSGVGRVTQMDVHPRLGNILLAATAAGGVWRSDNGAASWRPLMELEPTLTIGAVAFAPSCPSIIYAASGEDAGNWIPAWPGIGVYRSDDGGASWRLAGRVHSTRFSAIAVHPTDANILYVAGNRGLHKSFDGGATWINNTNQCSLFDGHVTDVVLAHDDPDRIYIGVSKDGVWRSTRGGAGSGAATSFCRLDQPDQLPFGPEAGWIKLAIGRSGANGSNFLVAKLGPDGSRIFATTDAGVTWQELANDVAKVDYDEWCSVIAVDPTDENTIYAGAAGALQRTTNGGKTSSDWTGIRAPQVHADQQDIVFNPADPTQIFLANDGGVYRSDDQGAHWEFTSRNLEITQLYDIDISEKHPGIVAGGAQDNGIFYRDRLGKWTNLKHGDGTQVAIDPSNPEIFYFSRQHGLHTGLARSLDGGATKVDLGNAGISGDSSFVTILKLDPTDPIADPKNKRIIFVCGVELLFRSVDSGQTWQRVEDAKGCPFRTDGAITALEFAPSDPGTLYLGTHRGAVYKGTGGGVTAADWTRIDSGRTDAATLFPNSAVLAIRIDPLSKEIVWLAFGGAGVTTVDRPDLVRNPLGTSHVFRTEDGGVNWSDASGQYPASSLPDVPTSAIALDLCDTSVAFVGTDVGVFRTTDAGTTWLPFQEGLARSPITELCMNQTYRRLYAATMGRGVYTRDV